MSPKSAATSGTSRHVDSYLNLAMPPNDYDLKHANLSSSESYVDLHYNVLLGKEQKERKKAIVTEAEICNANTKDTNRNHRTLSGSL